MFGNKKLSSLVSLLVIAVTILSACATPTPQVVEKEVVVEKPVVETVIVEKEVVVEKPVVQTVVVEVPAKPTPTVEPEKEIVVVQGIEPQTLDMQWINAVAVVNVGHHIQETLLDYDVDFDLKPLLATSWEQIEPTVWQFKLREGVKFSNGEPFNAEQVEFSVMRVKNETQRKLTRQQQTRYIDRVEIVDDYTVNFHTSGVVPLFDLYFQNFPIVPKGYVTEVGDEVFAREPVGTGPYLLEEWVKDDHITLVRNLDYWGPRPKADRLIFRSVPDIIARVATFLAGEADIVTDLQPATVPEIEKREELTVMAMPGLRLVFLNMNVLIDSPVKDHRVRQALNYAVDKQEIVETVMNGYATALPGQLCSPEYYGYNPGIQAYPYDPEKAKQLLAEAGYPEGLEVRLVCSRGRYMNDVEICQAVAGQLSKVGITLDVDVVEWSVHQNEYRTHEGGPIFISGFLTVPDCARMASVFQFGTSSSMINDPVYNSLVDEFMAATDREVRTQELNKALERFHDYGNWVYLHQQWVLTGVHNRLQDFVLYPDNHITLAQVDVSGPR